MTYKAIIFDLGQVVFKVGFSRRYEFLCKKYNIKPNTSVFEEFKKIWNRSKIGEIDSQEFFLAIANKLKINPEEVKQTLIEDISLNERIKDLIIKLSEKYRIGILTNNIKEFYEANLKLWNFEKIGPVVASFIDKVKKPDTNAIDLIINKLKMNKSEVILIDDNRDTVEKYEVYGVKSIRYENYEKLIQDLKKVGVKI